VAYHTQPNPILLTSGCPLAHPQVPGLRVESLRVLEVCTHLLKACAAAGLSLAEIAGVVTRPLLGVEEEPSELERVCFNARAEVEELSDEELVEAEESEESEGEHRLKGESFSFFARACLHHVPGAGLLADMVIFGLEVSSHVAREGCCSRVRCPDPSVLPAGEADFVAMLSVEEEVPEEFACCADSPTFSSASDATAFKMSLAGSEASRLEDALFRWAGGRLA
jgi:hypothetical protein